MRDRVVDDDGSGCEFVMSWASFREKWMAFWWGEPCPKHPGHRVREMDTELLTHGAFGEPACSECWSEFEEKYGVTWR